jgi:hypothetical protein
MIVLFKLQINKQTKRGNFTDPLYSALRSTEKDAYYWMRVTGLLEAIVMCMCDSRRGFGLDIGLIGHFSTQVVVTLNYSDIADFHTLQIT